MKSYSIGREEACNIVLYDSSNLVSRRHATINVNGSKMTITDYSSNGTYINGIRISSGTPVPVTRKDVVSFAQACELDWKQIPNPAKKVWTAVIIALVVIGIAVPATLHFTNSPKPVNEGRQIAVTDSLLKVRIDALSANIDKIAIDFDSLATDKSAVDKQIKDKQQGNKLNDVIQDLGKVELYMDGIDISSLKDDFKTAKQSVEDKVDANRSEKRVKETEDKAAKYTADIEAATKLMASVKKNLKDIPNSKPIKKGGKTTVKKDSTKVVKTDSIKEPILW